MSDTVLDPPDQIPDQTVPKSGPRSYRSGPNRTRINWVLGASLVGQGLELKDVAQRIGAKSGDVVRTGLKRRGIYRITETEANHVARQTVQIIVQKANKSLSEASNRLREKLSAEVEAQVAVLEQSPPATVAQLGSTKDGEGRASVVKRIAETAALVHDWESERPQGIVLGEVLSSEPEEKQAVAQVIDHTQQAIQEINKTASPTANATGDQTPQEPMP